MRLVTFQVKGGRTRAGALVDEGTRVLDLQAAHRSRYGKGAPGLASVLALVEGGPHALDLARTLVEASRRPRTAVLPLSEVKLAAPMLRAQAEPDPAAALRDMEAKGILAVPATWYERPIYYHPSRFSVCGHDDDVPWPSYCDVLDFELEFGCYVGRPGKDIPRERAREHVFGYTIFNDFSARDEQTREMPGQLGPGKGKDFDNANAMGPCLVTADEIPDPYQLAMKVRVNGEEWGRGHSGDMRWKFEDCIAHVARSETLRPGEFFGSGTVGDGSGLEHLRFLKPGDVVELEFERIGILRNRVVR